jgi:hypothetical protein
LSRELREGGEVAERRNDNSPAIYGWVKRQQNEKVPQSLAGLWTIACIESQP